jgi:hypothetical protein
MLEASYFDGKTARAHPARVTVAGDALVVSVGQGAPQR